MNESIYNLIPHEYEEPEKMPMYKPKSITREIPNSTFGCHGTTRILGCGVVEKKNGALFGNPKPEYGLTSTRKEKFRESFNGYKSRYNDPGRKSGVPAKEDKPIYGLRSNKNYITANAVECILKVPKKTTEAKANYMDKEDYGKVPEYLAHVKDEIQRENAMIERYIKEQTGRVDVEPIRYEEMDEDSRQELVNALKSKWASVNKEYQKITHLIITDNAAQAMRKTRFEEELDRLERDIKKLSRGKVLVTDG